MLFRIRVLEVDWTRVDFGVLVGDAVRDHGAHEVGLHVFARQDEIQQLRSELDALVVVADDEGLGDVRDAELFAQLIAPEELEDLDAGESVVRDVGHEHDGIGGEEGVLVDQAEARGWCR